MTDNPTPQLTGRDIVRQAVRSRFGLLFVTLIATLLLPPLLPKTLALNLIFTVLTTAVLLSGLYAVSSSRRHMLIGVAMLVPALALGWLGRLRYSPTLENVELAFLILFLAFVAWMLLLYVLAARRVDVNIVFGAICVYLLVGFICGYAYLLINLLTGSAAAFTGNISIDVPRSEAIYYSFVTLTTLGYGDIAPIAAASRALAIVEAVTGQVFMVTLMARIVSLQVAQSSRQ